MSNIVCPTSVHGPWSFLFASSASSRIYWAKLLSKHITSKICLPLDKMCLASTKSLKNLLVVKQQSSQQGDIVETFHGGQTMLVSITRP